jgi:prepilin-type N-terminal cleavage/methylation domain-containing protein
MENHNIKKGFTLVEIIIAVAILVMVMIPIGNAIIHSGKTNANSAKTSVATQLIQKNMEDIKSRLNASIRKGTEPYSTNAQGKKVDNASPQNLVDNEGNIINADGSIKKFLAEDLTLNAPGTTTVLAYVPD